MCIIVLYTMFPVIPQRQLARRCILRLQHSIGMYGHASFVMMRLDIFVGDECICSFMEFVLTILEK